MNSYTIFKIKSFEEFVYERSVIFNKDFYGHFNPSYLRGHNPNKIEQKLLFQQEFMTTHSLHPETEIHSDFNQINDLLKEWVNIKKPAESESVSVLQTLNPELVIKNEAIGLTIKLQISFPTRRGGNKGLQELITLFKQVKQNIRGELVKNQEKLLIPGEKLNISSLIIKEVDKFCANICNIFKYQTFYLQKESNISNDQ